MQWSVVDCNCKTISLPGVGGAERRIAMDIDGIGIEAPPRNTSKVPLPAVSAIRKAPNGRAILYVHDRSCTELRCSSSITQHVEDSKFLTHASNTRVEADWHRPTGLLCWHCCSAFDVPPIAIPKSFDAATSAYVVYGNFCSLSCGKAFIMDNASADNGLQITMLERMARETMGVHHIVAAPPRLSLAAFGGPYSLEAFRGGERRALLRAPPYVCSYMVVEERKVANNLSAFSSVPSGTVHGLRRPAQPHTMPTFDPSLPCPYTDFVAQKNQGATSGAASSSPAATVPPKPKAPPSAGTLAQFMKPK